MTKPTAHYQFMKGDRIMKKIVALLYTMILCFLLVGQVFAFADDNPEIRSKNDNQIVTRAEQTVWYSRINNKRLEKRLWSLTYGRWLTEWIPY